LLAVKTQHMQRKSEQVYARTFLNTKIFKYSFEEEAFQLCFIALNILACEFTVEACWVKRKGLTEDLIVEHHRGNMLRVGVLVLLLKAKVSSALSRCQDLTRI